MDWNDIVILIFSGLVAGSTVIYAFLTWRLVSETRRLRQVQTEPRVTVRLESDRNSGIGKELVIRNEGQGPAKDVRFTFEGDPTYFRGSFLNSPPPPIPELPVIRDGINYMAPGETLRFYLGNVTSKAEFDRAASNPWTFTVRQQDLSGKSNSRTYILDFSQFRGMFNDHVWLEEIAKHLKSVQQDVHRLTRGSTELHVITQTREDFLKNRQEKLAHYEKEAAGFTHPTPDDDDRPC